MMTEPMMGDFVLVKVQGQGGRLIRILQGLNGSGFDDYEHVALCTGQDTVIEMVAQGIRLARLSGYDGVPRFWSTGLIVLTDQQRHDIVTAAQGYLAQGIGYSWADYAALAARRLHVPAPGLRAYVASTGHMICSQLVARCYWDGGHKLYGRWTGYVTPGDLCELLERYG